MESSVNHLRDEKSPYLQQHSRNPVDWYPFSDEPFNLAKEKNMLLMVSVGYSTCHWCHVMERESFSRQRIGQVLNESFVCVKVDREERPDIDAFLIDFAIRTTGSAGWPLNVIMTPDRKPLLAFTYLPPESRGQNLGLIQMAQTVSTMWKENPEELLKNVSQQEPQSSSFLKGNLQYSEYTPGTAFTQLSRMFDPYYGGFSRSTKFPSPHNIMFLSSYYHSTGNKDALSMAERTVGAMRMGGIYDHAGLGIHRYSTDTGWKIPHFEKMLYDQASLILGLSDLYSVTGKDQYKIMMKETLHFLRNFMKSPSGGFYTAMDADSEGVEGLYYTWTQGEIEEALHKNSEEIELLFNITPEGNYMDEAKGVSTGRNILFMNNEKEDVERFIRDGLFWLTSEISNSLSQLQKIRHGRTPPTTDTKVLSDLNGLLLYAFSCAYSQTLDTDFLNEAKLLSEYLVGLEKDGYLPHVRYNDEKDIAGFFSDYVFTALGLTMYSLLSPNEENMDIVLRLMGKLSEEAEKDIEKNSKKGYGEFLGSWNSQEDSSMPSPYSAYERIQILLQTMGIQYKSASVSPEDLEGGLARYPSYFTFRVQNQLLNDHIFIIRKKNLDQDEIRDALQAVREAGISDVITFSDKDVKGSGYSLCTSVACVLEDTTMERIVTFILEKHKK